MKVKFFVVNEVGGCFLATEERYISDCNKSEVINGKLLTPHEKEVRIK